MPWRVVERNIGRAGGIRERTARQRDWDRRYGEGNWQVGYVIGGNFVLQEEALRNPHAEATTGVDLQVPAILQYLHRHGLKLQGTEVVDIGSWQGKASHPLSIRLSPLHLCPARPSTGRAWPPSK